MSLAAFMFCDAKLREPKERAAAKEFEVDTVEVKF